MGFNFSVVQDNAPVQDSTVRDLTNPTRIKVIGCGGGGSNAVRQMINDNVSGVDFVVMNTDLQALTKNPAQTKLPIGQKITGGLGSGGNPEVGEKAAIEDTASIEQVVSGADMIVLTAGMGGGTGTGSIPIVADIARKSGALTVAVVTTPFTFEGPHRMENAVAGVEKLREKVDSLIVVPNESVFKIIDNDSPFTVAFAVADDLLCQGVKGICEIITKEGVVNRDFNDMKTVLKDAGETLLGVGEGSGENRAIDAAQRAISNPMLEHMKIDGATKLLVNITGPANIRMSEINEINNTITASAGKNHHNLWGQIIDPTMEDKVRVIVIATGFNKKEAEPEVETESEKPYREDVVTADEIDDILNMKGSSNLVMDSERKEKQSSLDEKKTSLGDDLFGNFEPVKTSFNSSFSSSPSFSSQNDINKPACLRKQNSDYSKTINFSDD